MLQRNLTPKEQAIMFFQTRGLDVVHSGKEYMNDVTKMVVMESTISLTKYHKQLDKLIREMEQLENATTKVRVTNGMGMGILRYLIELIVNDQFPSHYWKKLMNKYSKYEMRVVKAQIIDHLRSEETNNYVTHLLNLNDECHCLGCLAYKLKEIYDVLMEGNKLTFQEGMSYQLNTIGKVKSKVIKDVSQIVTSCLLGMGENNVDYNKYGYSLNISNQPFSPIYIKDNNSDFQTYVRHIKTSEVETFVTQAIVEVCNKRGEKKEPLYVVYDEKSLPDGRKQQVTEAVGRGMDLEMYRQIREGQSESYSLDNVLIKYQIDELVCGKFYSEVKGMIEGYRKLPRGATPIFTQDFQIFNICIKVNMKRITKNSNEMSLKFISSSGKEREYLFYLNARSSEQRMNEFKLKFKEFLQVIVDDSKRAFSEGGIINLPIVNENVTDEDLSKVNANLNKDTKVKENVEVKGVHLKSSFDPIKEETTKLFIERVVNNLERMLSGDMMMKDGMYTTIGNGDTSIIYSFKKDGQIKFEMVNRGKVIFQASFEPNMINAKPILDVALTTQLKYTRVQFENDFEQMKMESEMRPNVSGAKELFKGFADSILNELKKGEVQMNETLDTVATQRKAQNEMIDGKKQKAIADLIVKIMDKKMYLDSVKSGTVKETSTEFKFGDLELKINMESVDTDHLVVTFRDGNGNLISSGGIRGDYDSIHSFVMKLITESIKPLILDVSVGAIMKDMFSRNLNNAFADFIFGIGVKPKITLLGDRMFGRDKKKGTFEGFLRDAIESYLNGKKDLPVVNVGIFDGECYSVNINKVTGDTSTVALYSKNGELFKGQICDELVCVDTLIRDIVLSTKGRKEPEVEVSEINKLRAFINNNLLTYINKMKANVGNGLTSPEKFERNFAGKNVTLVVDEKSDTHLHIVLMFDGVSTLNIPVPKHNFKPNEFAGYVVANPFINTTLLNKPERLTESKEHQKDMKPLWEKMYKIGEDVADKIIPDDFLSGIPSEVKDFLQEQKGKLSLESFVEMFNNFKFKTPDEIEEESPICDCCREKEIYVNLIIENIEAYVDMKTSKALSLVLPNGCPVVISHNIELDEILVTVNNIHEFKLTPEFHTQEVKQLAETLMKDVDLDIESFESEENDKVDVTINPFEGSMKVGIMEVPVKRQVQDLEEAPKAETKDQKFVEVWGIKQMEDGKFKVTIEGSEFVGTLNECLMKTLKSKASN